MALDLRQLADLAASLTLATRKQLDAAGSITGPADDRRYYAQATAFVLLARTLHLLDEQAVCVLSKAPEAARMLLRQIIELDITGRYLLSFPDQVDWAVDETYRQRRAQLAGSRMDPNDPLAVAFSQEHPIPKGHLRSNIEQMAAAVGSVDQYVSLYRQISRTVMHSLDSLEPYSSMTLPDTNRLEIHPQPVISPAFLSDEEALTWGIVVTYNLARHAVTNNDPMSLTEPLIGLEPSIVAALQALPELPEDELVQ
jgi:hypothetical protein